MKTQDSGREQQAGRARRPDPAERFGSVAIPAVVAALRPGESGPCPRAEERRRRREAFLLQPRFALASSD